MSGLVRVVHDPDTGTVDLAVDERGFIALDSGLETPVFESLFTDRRAPERRSDRRGWWGDAHAVTDGDQIGSLLWLLSGGQLTTEAIRQAQLHAEQALDWLKRDSFAKAIEVVAEADGDWLILKITVTRPDGEQEVFSWRRLWGLHGV